jgi:hypothetical protein
MPAASRRLSRTSSSHACLRFASVVKSTKPRSTAFFTL